jgi:3-(3-hydroxy-phenyl)propionate hydroxylase
LDAFNAIAPGVGTELARRGVTWHIKRTYFKNRLLFSEEYPQWHGDGLPPFVNISQVQVDSALYEAARRLYSNLITFDFDCTVTSLEQDESCVRLQTANGGEYLAECVIGADGGKSAIRKSLGVGLKGLRSSNRFLIVDIESKLDIPMERRFYYSPASNPGLQAFMMPQPDDVWRLDWQVPLGFELDHERTNGRLDWRIRSLIGRDQPYNIKWATVYNFNNLKADTFNVGRVFLTGDAAHLFSPFGGRGLNSAVADSKYLGDLLPAVIREGAPMCSLSAYNIQRQAAAVANLTATSRVLRVMVPPTHWHRFVRYAAIRTAPYLRSAQQYVDSGPYATTTKTGNGETKI